MKKLMIAFSAAFAATAATAAGVTYYAVGGGTANNYACDWNSPNNWRLGSATSEQIPTTAPGDGDIVVFNSAIKASPSKSGSPYMSAPGSGTAPLGKVLFNVGSTIHQGMITLKSGGEGFVMGNFNMTWWAGIRTSGTGEVPIHVPAGYYFHDQKGVGGDSSATLVKTGGGLFITAYENKDQYQPQKTILMGGKFAPRVNAVCQNQQFTFGSNDGDLRLQLTSRNKDNPDWKINDGAIIESNVVDNTTHGISIGNLGSAGNYEGFGYVRLTGRPKLAEQRFTGRLYDRAGIDFMPNVKQAGGADYVFTIAKSASTGGGGLIVSNATMRLAEGATFTGLDHVIAGNGGTFKVEQGSGEGFFCQKLEVAEGGKLNLGAGVRVGFGSVTVAGLRLPVGVYSATGADGTTAVDWIDGDGVVEATAVRILNPIVVSVPESQTLTLAEALDAYNAEHADAEGFTAVTLTSLAGGADKDRTLVKTGTGRLNMATAIDGYDGAIDVREGVMACGCKYSLGSDTTAKHINVRSGATVLSEMTASNKNINNNQTFHIAGNGFNDMGALRTDNTHIDYGTKNYFGRHLILEGDAKVRHGVWKYLPNDSITLNGYIITYHAFSGTQPVYFTTVNDNGKIIMIGSQNRSEFPVFNGTDPNNTIEFRNSAGWRFWGGNISGAGKDVWKFNFVEGTNDLLGDRNFAGRESGNQTFFNPFYVASGTTLRLTSQNNTAGSSVYLQGPVSGGGTILLGEGQGASEPRTMHFLNEENTFGGKVTADCGVASFYGPGTLPKAATLEVRRNQSVVYTYDSGKSYYTMPAYYGAAFFSPATLDLGPCVLKGSYAGRVQGGIGSFASVEKSGANTIEYYTELGAPTLNVKAGTFKLPRGAAPGLWEGANYFSAIADKFNGAETMTNFVMRGPHTANARVNENYTPSAATRLMTYTGYIWNRTGADAKWTFVSSVTGPVKIKIDGEEILATTGADLQKVQKTLAPGAHAFEYRSYNAGPRSTGWGANYGFAYTRNEAVDVSAMTTNDCELCIDPGDGSLFTRSLDAADLPAFGAIAVAEGATLDVNGNRYEVADISGAGTVESSATDAMAAPALVVNGMTVNAAVHETLQVNVPVEIGGDFSVSVTNMANKAAGNRVVLSAPQGITTSGAMRVVADDGSRWTARVSSDGKSLEVARTGFTVIVR